MCLVYAVGSRVLLCVCVSGVVPCLGVGLYVRICVRNGSDVCM